MTEPRRDDRRDRAGRLAEGIRAKLGLSVYDPLDQMSLVYWFASVLSSHLDQTDHLIERNVRGNLWLGLKWGWVSSFTIGVIDIGGDVRLAIRARAPYNTWHLIDNDGQLVLRKGGGILAWPQTWQLREYIETMYQRAEHPFRRLPNNLIR
jgi:hypothetical protein